MTTPRPTPTATRPSRLPGACKCTAPCGCKCEYDARFVHVYHSCKALTCMKCHGAQRFQYRKVTK